MYSPTSLHEGTWFHKIVLFLGPTFPNDNPLFYGLLPPNALLVRYDVGVPVKLAAIAAVLDLTDLHHEIDQVLNAKYAVVSYGILLVDGLHKKPEVLNHFYLVGVHPKVTTPHH